MSPPAFRFAPSPNGYLHLGHAYSALANFHAARQAGGRFLVRIEDIDRLRCTRALAQAVLEDLAWLGLSWEEPVRYQSEHMDDYRAALRKLGEMGLLYPCFCSRGEIARHANPHRCDPDGQPLYPGTCKHLTPGGHQARLVCEAHAWRIDMAAAAARLAVPLSFEEQGRGRIAADPKAWGDVVLARKEIGTSYHIAVIMDDAIQGITHVVRGRDLFHATAIHRLLQELLGLSEPRYRHHDLIGDETGRKLSKSAGDRSLRSLRREGAGADVIRAELGF